MARNIRNDITGQLGLNQISMVGTVSPGWVLTIEQDPNNPAFWPSSCGPGSHGGSIATTKGFKQVAKSLWPTRK